MEHNKKQIRKLAKLINASMKSLDIFKDMTIQIYCDLIDSYLEKYPELRKVQNVS